MKKFSLFLLVSFSTSVFAQKPEGAYNAISAQYGDITASPLDMMKERVVKIFKDGYWMAASFGNSFHPFRGCTGGTFSVKDGKYMETVAFSSWDSTATNKVFLFDYKVQKNEFFQNGFVNSVKYPNHLVKEQYEKIVPDMPLKDSTLEGVWLLESTVWDDDNPFKNPIVEIKIYCFPRFGWAQYDATTHQFIGAGGGTYQFDGETVIERVDYFTYEMALGTKYKGDVKLKPDGTMQQTSWGGRMIEIWRKKK